jgi:hypothetical protein
MAPRVDRVGEAIAALRAANDGTADAVERIRAALTGREPRLITAAARLTGESLYESLVGDLLQTVERLATGGQPADPQCHAKEAILVALKALGHEDPEVFLRGLAIHQFDPAFGSPPPGEETAGGVRAASALALPATTLNVQALLRALGPLLFDTSPYVRQEVVRALGACSCWEAALLLEVKVKAGDAEAAVIGECFIELLNLDAERYLALVVKELDAANRTLRLQAVCALSECRNPLGMHALIASCTEFVGPDDLEMRFFALGRSRHDAAASYLEDRVGHGSVIERDLARRAIRLRSVPAR